eukprot:GGOE01002802.1.p1 GENE.GGOE01002802.1~~GGOE01002802.1.p1  ORF type:complete len:370 (+),score=58.74 GGOE01002802.1:497-1606(+)
MTVPLCMQGGAQRVVAFAFITTSWPWHPATGSTHPTRDMRRCHMASTWTTGAPSSTWPTTLSSTLRVQASTYNNAHSNTLRGNVLVGNAQTQLSLDEGDDIVGPNSVRNNSLRGNCLVAPQGGSPCLQEVSKFSGAAAFQFYANSSTRHGRSVFYCPTPHAAVTQRLKGRFSRQLSLHQYQQSGGQLLGITDVCLTRPDWCRRPAESIILLSNPTSRPLTFALAPSGRYHLLCNGFSVPSTVVTVRPFAAEVVVVSQPGDAPCPLRCHQRGSCHTISGVCRCDAGYAGQGCELDVQSVVAEEAQSVGERSATVEWKAPLAVGVREASQDSSVAAWLSVTLLAAVPCLALLVLLMRWRRKRVFRRPRTGA